MRYRYCGKCGHRQRLLQREQPILSLRKFHRSRALRVVVRHVVDPTADGIAAHQTRIVGPQQFGDRRRRSAFRDRATSRNLSCSRITGMRSWIAEVTALGVVVRIEHDFTHCPLGSRQRSHSPAKANRPPSPTSKQKGCFAEPRTLPLVKAVCRDQASAESQRIAKSGLRGCCFRACVDHSCRARRVLRPRRNQSPPHQRHIAPRFLRMLADHRDGLRRSDVVPRRPVVLPIGSVKLFLDDLLSPGQSVAPAHGGVYVR